jgi:4-hydroxy-tetrahydrodipicolinate synthase
MPRAKTFQPAGVIPASILPFHDELSLDLVSFKRHLTDTAAVAGVTAITINAHSTEVASCTLDEQARVMAAAVEAIGDKVPLVHGVYAEGSLEAARIAKQATAGGASALLVFPPGLSRSDKMPRW